MISKPLPLLLFSVFITLSGKQKIEFELKNKELMVKKMAEDKIHLDLIDIHDVNKNILLDIRYATKNNVFKKAIYSSAKCYFRKHVAIELDKIQKELEPMGLGLKIWDGYRPWQVQVDGYAEFPGLFGRPTEERSRHPRGTAVDLTLVDKNGQEILMPTEFDNATKKASRLSTNGIDKRAIANRDRLAEIMVKHGFIPLPDEWWHFDHYSWQNFSTIRLSFDEIEKRLNLNKNKKDMETP